MLRRELRLIRLGLAAELRNPALRLLAVVGALSAAVFAWKQGDVAGSTAVVLAAWMGRVYGFAACLWFATAAVRDQNHQLGAVLRSKPVDGARWVLVNWATGLVLWLTLLGVLFAGAAIGQLPAAGLGSLQAHALGFARAGAVLVSVATLGFALSRLMNSPLGSILVLFAWFCAMAGLRFIPRFLRPEYAQNQLLFIGAAVLLCSAACIVERFRRREAQRPLLPALAVLACALSAVGAVQAQRAAAPAADGSVWDYMERQYLQVGLRAPGFELPDGKGGVLRSSDHHGKVLLIYLFPADDLEAAKALPLLDALSREYGPRGVQPIGICLSTDQGDGRALVRAGGYSFPIGSDLTTVSTGVPPESSLANAYDAETLPVLVITDRRRRAREVLREPSHSLERLRMLVEKRLEEEPE